MTARMLDTITRLPGTLFESPQRLVRPDWAGHLPFLAYLLGTIRPKCYVELGVFHGDSYCYACQTRVSLGLETQCVGIDSWEGDIHIGGYGEEVYTDLRAHHDPRYAGFSSLCRGLFEEQVDSFDDASIDLLHIDGEHTYEAVSTDFRTWLPKVAPGGVILLHDTDVVDRDDFGVWKLWKELSSEWPTFRFHHCNGLGVVLNGSTDEVARSLEDLFRCEPDEEDAIRAFFEAIGDRYMYQAYLGLARNLRPTDGTSPDLAGVEGITATLEEYSRIVKLLSRSRLRKLRYVLTGRL